MTSINHNDDQICSHNPSSRVSLLAAFAEFLFCRRKLICSDTELAVCARCGRIISPPTQYYSKHLLAGYAVTSVLIGLLCGTFVLNLANNLPYYYACYSVGAYGLFFAITYLIDRIVSAFIFTLYGWETADVEECTERANIAFDGDTVDMDERKQYCRRQKSLRGLMLIIGGLVFAILMVIY